MSNSIKSVLVSIACIGALGCTESYPIVYGSADLAAFEDLADGWTELAPEGQTTCSDGSDYMFYVRPAAVDRVVYFLQGGGACWSGATCDLEGRPSYDPTIDERDNPTRRSGIFDFDNPDNPLSEYSMVFVPYCTGDVHIGDTTVTYPVAATDSTPAREVTVHHNGYANAMAALEWTFRNFSDPSQVFVAGSSAGSIASPFYTSIIADRYDEARIVMLGDASGGYRSSNAGTAVSSWNTTGVLPDGPEYASIPSNGLNMERFVMATGARHPRAVLTQFNTANDAVQVFFLNLLGDQDVTLLDLIEANYADIRRDLPEFRAFTSGGDVHTILSRPQFYTYQENGTRLRDWVADLEAGRPVEDVMCADCSVAGTVNQ